MRGCGRGKANMIAAIISAALQSLPQVAQVVGAAAYACADAADAPFWTSLLLIAEPDAALAPE